MELRLPVPPLQGPDFNEAALLDRAEDDVHHLGTGCWQPQRR